jgi:hypothetical protein
VTDFLPTNMRFFSGGGSEAIMEQNQKITVWIYYNGHGENPTAREFEYKYSGRVMYPGDFIAESAYLLHENDLVEVRTPRITAVA